MILLNKLHCIFHSLVWDDFEQRWCSSFMTTMRGRHYSLKQQTQFTMTNKVIDPLAYNINDFLRRATVFLHLLERGFFAQNWCSSLMKMVRGRQYTFQKLTQFTMLNKMLDPLYSNIDDSLTRGTVLLPFTRMGWFCKKLMILPVKTLAGRQCSFKQLTEFTMLKRLLDPLASNISDSLTRATELLPFNWMWWLSKKVIFLTQVNIER
jgi:hypothetical protein